MQQPVDPQLVFDPMDPEFMKDPYPILTRFRERSPAHFWPPGDGYIFFRYRDYNALMREPRLSHDPTLGVGLPAEIKAAFPDYAAFTESSLFTLEPASHARIRKLVNPLLTPRAIEIHRPLVEQLIRQQLDQLPQEGIFDVATLFSRRYPVRVIAGVLHIPPGHEDTFVAFADALIALVMPGLPQDVFVGYMPTISRGAALLRELIAERRAAPIEGDLFSMLVHACDADDRLSEAELFSLIGALIVGGSDTTVSLTSYAIYELLRHPDQLARLRADGGLARGAADETLRYNGFGRAGLVRFVAEDFVYEGVQLHRGQPVYLQMMSAFRDPEFLADADTYDIGRQIAGSPWFGWGPHFCVGASLARMEAELALRLFFARYPAIELAAEPVYGHHPMLRDMAQLQVRALAS